MAVPLVVERHLPGPLRRLARGPWGVPLLAGLLIAFGFAVKPASPALYATGLLAATALAGVPIARRAVADLSIRRIGIEALVTIAVGGAIIIGELWEAAAVTFLFALGSALERATVGRTRQALSHLLDLAPETATVRRDGEEVVVSPLEVRPGEIVVVRPGAKVPVDGEVVAGRAAIDESSITGESMPVEKEAGHQVFAGTVTAGGLIDVRATAIGGDTALARIIHRVEEAQEAKAPAQQLIERFAAWYTPAIVILAVGAYVATGSVELALTLLVIGCPGALVISMPVAMVAGVGRAARDGILVKGGADLERLGAVDAVAFDKTGTLTEGRPHLTDVIPLAPGITEPEVLHLAALAEVGSEHPLAIPILEGAADRNLPIPGRVDPDAFTQHAGAGVATDVDGTRVAVGTPRLAEDLGVPVPAAASEVLTGLRHAGRTAVLVLRDDEVVGVIGIADRLRPDAAAGVAELRRRGVDPVLVLSGDAQAVVDAMAGEAGIVDGRGDLSPDDKLAVIEELRRSGKVVAMVGDGVNDAPALAAADVGVSVGSGATAVAVETADVVVLSGRLAKIAEAIDASRRTTRVVRQNVVISLVTVASLLAGVLAGEVFMAAGMLVHQASVLVVVLNAVRLLRRRGAHPAPKLDAPVPSDPVAASTGAGGRADDLVPS